MLESVCRWGLQFVTGLELHAVWILDHLKSTLPSATDADVQLLDPHSQDLNTPIPLRRP